jgi:hypothetical protein
MVGTSLDHDGIAEALTTLAARQFEPHESDPLLFRVSLAGEVDAGFLPATRADTRRHRNEVAAWRIGRFLRLEGVPPAVLRSFPLAEMRDNLHDEHAGSWPDIEEDVAAGPDGQVPGAAIYWVPEARELNALVEGPRRREIWRGLLVSEDPPSAENVPLASDLSSLVAFDYLAGNIARLDGGRIDGIASAQRLYIRGYVRAFPAELAERDHRRLHDKLQEAQRFSRSFVERLSRLDAAALTRLLAVDGDEPLLSAAAASGVLHRREALLSWIGSLVDVYGEAQVLAFP